MGSYEQYSQAYADWYLPIDAAATG